MRSSLVSDGGGGGHADFGCWLKTLRTSFSNEGGVCARAAPTRHEHARPVKMRNRRVVFIPQRVVGRWSEAPLELTKITHGHVFGPRLDTAGITGRAAE